MQLLLGTHVPGWWVRYEHLDRLERHMLLNTLCMVCFLPGLRCKTRIQTIPFLQGDSNVRWFRETVPGVWPCGSEVSLSAGSYTVLSSEWKQTQCMHYCILNGSPNEKDNTNKIKNPALSIMVLQYMQLLSEPVCKPCYIPSRIS